MGQNVISTDQLYLNDYGVYNATSTHLRKMMLKLDSDRLTKHAIQLSTGSLYQDLLQSGLKYPQTQLRFFCI